MRKNQNNNAAFIPKLSILIDIIETNNRKALDIKAYIASGILEQYALGALDAVEQAEVEEMVAKYPEVKLELELVQDALLAFATTDARTPRASLEGDILQMIETADYPPQSKLTPPPTSNPSRSIISLILPWLVTLIMAVTAIYLWSRFNQAIETLEKTQADLANCEQQLTQFDNNKAIAANPDSEHVLMHGCDLGVNDAFAYMHFNSQDQTAYLDIQSLPAITADEQYQVWAIVEGQAPLSIGLVPKDLEGNSLIPMDFIADASVFAITKEPLGGRDAPTLEEMKLAGNRG